MFLPAVFVSRSPRESAASGGPISAPSTRRAFAPAPRVRIVAPSPRAPVSEHRRAA
jgi:hypothetical protein